MYCGTYIKYRSKIHDENKGQRKGKWIILLHICVCLRSSITSFEGGGGDGLVAKSCPTLTTPWTVACQAPLSMGFFRQGYRSGLPFPSPSFEGSLLLYMHIAFL